MKLVIFSKHYYPEKFLINKISIRLNNLFSKITVFTSFPYYNYKKDLINNVKINTYNGIDIIRSKSYLPRSKKILEISINYLTYIIILSFKCLFIHKKKGDVIFVYATSPIFQTIPALLYSWKYNIPLVLWVQDLWPEVLIANGYVKNKFIIKVLYSLIKIIYDKSDLILVQSNGFEEEIRKISNNKNIKLHFNPYQKNQSSYFENHSDKITICYAGNLGKSQKITTLIEALKINKNKNIYLKIIGEGSEKESIKSLLEKYNLKSRVLVLQYLEEEDLFKEFINVDFFYMSLGSGPGLSATIPSKFQMYLSFGIPIISGCNGEVNNLVNQNNLGVIIDELDPIIISKGLDKAYELSNLEKKQLSSNCLNFFNDNFELEKNIDILYKNLKSLEK